MAYYPNNFYQNYQYGGYPQMSQMSQSPMVNSSVYLDIPTNCCSQISVENTSAQSVSVQNANLIVERVA